MASKQAMDDMLVVIPGITGSILTKNGNTIWGPVPQSIVGYIESVFSSSGGWSFDDLRIAHEDPDVDDLGDGIKATGLVPYTLVPGLACFDGYSGLRKQLRETFDLKVGQASQEHGPTANYFELAYDWRRDNRASARRLQTLVDRELPKWRAYRNYPSAKVILIGHSMGGLVARYYVECLGGWEHTRAIITFGTPHRGSVQAVDYLVNGYRKLGFRLSEFTELMRSFRSVYQLLPIYECVEERDETGDPVWRRVADTALPKIEESWAQEALQFHREIERCHETNTRLDEYDVSLLPVIGWGHTTVQSAKHAGGSIEFGTELPPAVDDVLTGGDGTVPRVSAIPIELHNKPTSWWPWNQKHATMQNNQILLGNISQTLLSLQGRLGKPARGPGAAPERNNIDLQIDEVYLQSELVVIRLTATTDPEPNSVGAEIQPLEEGRELPTLIDLKPTNGAWAAEPRLAPGAYRITVRLHDVPIDPVVDVFEVV